MGEQGVKLAKTTENTSRFIGHLMNDIRAMDWMLANNMFETGITRIGAEQEFCLVTEDWRPSNRAVEILSKIDDPHFTTELAKYNLEINLDPVELKGNCFTKVEQQLTELLQKASKISEENNTKIILTGILPTIGKEHLSLDYITPKPRYFALNEKLLQLKKENFHLHLQGVDELTIRHDSVLFEACNTSFQLHLQIDPDDFISSYNWAQAISGPILSVCTNSPILLGRELWNETRIALFRQSIDTRTVSTVIKEQPPRVGFGLEWATGTASDIFKNNIAQYKNILFKEIEKNSFEEVKQGKIPKLEALNLHNGTIYPWNRACYGVGNGKAHLRIENRYIPSGPSILDEMANFALWVGVMIARPKKFDDMSTIMNFKDAKSNFIKAARYGKDALLIWEDKHVTIKQLMENIMLPLAYRGLASLNINTTDIQRLLGIIEQRVNGKSGAQWIVRNFRELNKIYTKDTSQRLLARAMYKKQKLNTPINQWADIKNNEVLKKESLKVGHVMSTHLFTVQENDLAVLVVNIMDWKNIHHMPVENEQGQLVGLLTHTHIRKFQNNTDIHRSIVRDIMTTNVITVKPETTIKNAIALMKNKEIGCLPVKDQNELIGIVTIKDIIAFDHD